MSQVSGMILVIGMMQAVKYFDLANSKNTVIIRTVYGVVQVVMLVALFVLRSRIMKARLSGQVRVPRVPNPFTDTGNEPTEEVMTTQEYDLREWRKLAQSHLFSTLLLVVIHGYFKNLQPLIFQSVIPLKTLFSHQLVKLYIFNQKAEGKLVRPWKEAGGLAELLGARSDGDAEQQESDGPRIVELSDDDGKTDSKAKKIDPVEDKDASDESEPLLKQRRKPGRKADD